MVANDDRGVKRENAGLLKVPEAARWLSLSERMVWGLIKEGRIKSIKIGRAVRVRPTELEAFVALATR